MEKTDKIKQIAETITDPQVTCDRFTCALLQINTPDEAYRVKERVSDMVNDLFLRAFLHSRINSRLSKITN